MKPYGNKTALFKSALKTVMDPPGGLKDVWYSKGREMLNFTFDALHPIQPTVKPKKGSQLTVLHTLKIHTYSLVDGASLLTFLQLPANIPLFWFYIRGMELGRNLFLFLYLGPIL